MRSLFLACLCAASLCTSAQSKKFTFKLGTEYELPRKSDDLSFFGNDKDGIVNLTMKKKELTIMRFDPKTLVQTEDKVIQLEEATKNFNSEVVVDFGTNCYWLHSDWDKSEERETLYYDQVDVKSGKMLVTNKKIHETSRLAGDMMQRGFYSYKVDNKYQFNFDADKKHLLVTYRLFPEEKRDKKNYDKLGFQVYDDQMKKLWGGEFTMPYTEAVMDNSDFSIDSEGNAYLLAKVYNSDARKEKDKETGGPGYHYEVMKFSKGNKNPTVANISLDDYFIKSTVLIESSNHDMLIASTYSKRSNKNGTDGVFLAMMDASTGKVKKYKNGYYEFPLAELEKFESARSKRRMERKDDYEAPNMTPRNVLIQPDGSVFITLEEYYVVSTTHTTSNGSSYTTYTYYYEDIIGCRINAKGEFEWMRKIPKKQRGSNGRGGMSFKLISDASGYYMLYLDNLKNMELAEDEVPKYHMDGYGGQVVVTRISPKGEVSKEVVFDTREEDLRIFPSSFSRISGTHFIGRASVKRGGYRPLLITVN